MVIGNVFLRQSPLLRRLPALLSQAILNKNPTTLAATLSSSTMKPFAMQKRSSLLGNNVTALSVRGTATEISKSLIVDSGSDRWAKLHLSEEIPPSRAGKFYWERVWSLAMFPLFPAALFIHNPVMDYAIATAVALHIHW